ncbi:MAG TPA: site-specific integrase [Tepidisphaeraceae bacterium]|nr:site-specific integrase [Tepidisphaeraceae bacterium]
MQGQEEDWMSRDVWIVDRLGVIRPSPAQPPKAPPVPVHPLGSTALVVAGPRRDGVLIGTRGGVIGTAEDLAALAEQATRFADGARAEATRQAYRSDWRHFEQWCRERGLSPLLAMPETVGLYLAAHADLLSMATLTRRVSSIAVAHRMAGYPMDTRHPAIRDVMRGLRRAKGSGQRHAEALTTPLLRLLLATCGDRLIDVRDRALLLVAFGAALRRSELVGLTVEDVTVLPEGLRITVRRSKTDQEGTGHVIAVGRTGTATCPAAAYEAWVAEAGITEGRAFRAVDRHQRVASKLSTNAVAEIVQRRAALAGLDAEVFSGHSMRAGFATSAAASGIEDRVIAKQTRHTSMATLARYIRDGHLFKRNLSQEVGL